MHSYKHILVPVDLLDFSETATHHAMHLAQVYKGHVTLLHVASSNLTSRVSSALSSATSPDPVGYNRERLGAFAKTISQLYGARPDFECIAGPPGPSIVQFARDDDFDLIVMGTHGRYGLPRLLLGSVANFVVQRAPCAVFTIPLAIARCAPPLAATPPLALSAL